MADVQELELRKTSDEPSIEARVERPFWLWLVVAALVVATTAAAYIVVARMHRPAPATADQRPEHQAPVRPLGGNAAPINLPPLDQSDPIVRELVKQISSHPRIAAWLATDGLIRTLTVAVENVADGSTPARRFHVLRPASAFETVARGGDLHIAPRSYERYDDLADAAASIDAAGAARLYATLKPRIEEAYRDLGFPDTPFDRTLERAIVLLLRTPASDGAARLEPRGIGYGFVDPGLERLTAAQKQLLRTGPRNVRIIQSSLRQFALALGIPAERLPVPPS
ncbi:MAG TPA: DUF3014 domain-containing protein [Vicinamibacterales bacterium]|nr:DUF3014 domain-containing protein [Vicinamibacterales bacterium]